MQAKKKVNDGLFPFLGSLLTIQGDTESKKEKIDKVDFNSVLKFCSIIFAAQVKLSF